MNCKKIMAGLLASLLLCFNEPGFAAVPVDAPKDVKHILGFYYGNGENILIRENNGDIELLYRTLREDKCFDKANIFRLQKNHFDSYTIYEAGPINNAEATVSFERDQEGYGITCKVGGHRYSRYFLGQGMGEKAKPFKFPAVNNWDELRNEAAAAIMPAALQQGNTAALVNINSAAGIRVNSHYAAADNCFSTALYSKSSLYLDKSALQALVKVNNDLAAYGYGIVVWDAYRPWSVSKLAYLALPENKKGMLEDPDLKGSQHNTGLAVDVSLYDLESGVEEEMLSGFDEPSMRQYSSYPGGTSKQRYLRFLLRETMEKYGFRGIEMEWWHFEYQDIDKYAHLNIPLENLQ